MTLSSFKDVHENVRLCCVLVMLLLSTDIDSTDGVLCLSFKFMVYSL